LLNIVAAILLFGFIIMFHELGHFLLAKANGVAVMEFSIGMGPRLASVVWRGTRYSLKILPLGGSCAMADEDTDSGDPNGFLSKSVWARISVIAAGPVFNFILVFIFGVIIVWYCGYDLPVISGIMEGYPAEAAGIEEGDIIFSINGKKLMEYRDLQQYLMLHPEEELIMECGRLTDEAKAAGVNWYTYSGKEQVKRYTATLATRYSEENKAYMMGIEHQMEYHKPKGIGHLFSLGWHEVIFQGRSAIESFRLLFRGYLGTEDLGGPVRIVAEMGETVGEVRSAGWLSVLLTLMNIGVVLSATLGTMNLLPIPALDGGRLAFLLVEAVRGRAISQEKEGMIHLAGMVVLMGLMLLIMFNDIRNLIFR